jgi:hypothetical protein
MTQNAANFPLNSSKFPLNFSPKKSNQASTYLAFHPCAAAEFSAAFPRPGLANQNRQTNLSFPKTHSQKFNRINQRLLLLFADGD